MWCRSLQRRTRGFPFGRRVTDVAFGEALTPADVAGVVNIDDIKEVVDATAVEVVAAEDDVDETPTVAASINVLPDEQQLFSASLPQHKTSCQPMKSR